MRSEKSCPVCGRHGLTSDCAHCPQCDADLTCFQALDSLAGRNEATGSSKNGRRFPAMAAVVLLAIIALILAVLLLNMKKNIQELDRRLTELKTTKPVSRVSVSSADDAAGSTETGQSDDLTRISEKLTASSGKIYQVDARIRIMDESYDEFFSAKSTQQRERSEDKGGEEKREDIEPQDRSVSQQQHIESEIERVTATAEELTEEKKTVPVAEKGRKDPPAQTAETIKVEQNREQELERKKTGGKNEQQDRSEPQQQQIEVEVERVAVTAGELAEEKKTVPVAEKGRKDPPAQTAKTIKVEQKKPLPLLKPGKKKRNLSKKAKAKNVDSRSARSKKLPDLQDAPGRTFLYQARSNETLWNIAERFYGNGAYYPVILEQNPHLWINNINSKSTMRLFKDRRRAAALYKRKRERRDGMLLWKYEVQPGENWGSVYRRFFSPDSFGRVFYSRNPQVFPGNTVKIILR